MMNFVQTPIPDYSLNEWYLVRSDLDNFIKFQNAPNTFYASDIDVKGGTLNGWQHHGLIRKTGNVKETFFCIDEKKDLYKKSKVYEWEKTEKVLSYADRYEAILIKMQELIELLKIEN